MATESLPEWVTYIASGIGIVIVTVVGRLAWKAPANTSTVEVAGAIVDNKAARDITETMKAVMIRYQDIEEEKMELIRDFQKILRDTSNEVRTLHQEIRELTREVIRNGGARDSHRN